MKKILLLSLLAVILVYVFKQKVYDPYLWKKSINTPEHALKLGSFIFSKKRGSNGSQSYETHYLVYKVTEINGDYVRLSVIRKLSQKDAHQDGDFSTTEEDFEKLKHIIKQLTVTGILREDLYKEDNRAPFEINDYLMTKYPALQTSRYYFEDVANNKKNIPMPSNHIDRLDYFEIVYSKKEIIEHGELTPWVMNNRPYPEILYNMAKSIDLIQN